MGKQKETGALQYDQDAPAHTVPFERVLQTLSVHQDSGLSEDEAKDRKNKYGPNQLDEGPGVQPFRILVHQVANALTLVSIPGLIISRHVTHNEAGPDHGYGGLLCYQILD